ncbi:MAG: phosphatase PAP2 family protein [Bacteroidota bacterium]
MNFSTFDIALLTWLHDHTIPFSIPVLQFISNSTTFTSITMVMIVLILSVIRKSKPLLMRFFMLAIVLIVVGLVSLGLKSIIDRDRPFDTYPFIEKLSTGGDSSFPSGHTMEAFALAAALSLLFSGKKIAIPVYIWAIIVAYSRMALGVHYPSDVLAGMIIGTFIGWVVPFIFKRYASAFYPPLVR